MSAFDPLAALAQSAVAAAQQSIAEATLTLGDAAQILQAQITVGDQIPATILAPVGGQDLLSFLGQTVVAQLSPGLHPGETLLLQVTGFQGNQIVVRNLGTVDPEQLPPSINEPLPEAAHNAPQSAVLTSVAPPVEVFVAASVRPSAVDARVAPEAESTPVSSQGILEARIAATRAAGSESTRIPNRAQGAVVATPRAQVSPRAPTAPSVPSPIIARVVAQPAAALAARTAAAATSPEETLLTRLRVPITPITLAAVKTMSAAPRAIPQVFAELDRALAPLIANDPRVAPLRALLAFTGRINPESLRTLPEQLASFVANVLDGAESKLAAIVTLLQRGAVEESAPTIAASPAAVPAGVQAQVAERSLAIASDVKSVILALLASPPESATPALAQTLTQALTQVLTAVTSLQLNSLNAQAQSAQVMTIAFPVFYREGGAASQVRITRDGANGQRLDRDNFHVAFVLDTQTLGTVAIDLQAVGRSVSVDVKTEEKPAANRFAATLSDLRGRLEGLHYRVASLAAAVAPPRAPMYAAPTSIPEPDAAGESNPPAQLDVRA